MQKRIPVITEDDDTDVVSFQVEGHASNTWAELDHLSGLDLIEAYNSGNTVSNTDHSSELFDIILNRKACTTWVMFMILSWMTLAVSAMLSFLEKLWVKRTSPLILCWIIIIEYSNKSYQ